jgi:4-amino-4-deoxy-L-arabinose transferase-like glycosyltransferase
VEAGGPGAGALAAPRASPFLPRAARVAGLAAAALALLVPVLWLLDAAGRGAPPGLARMAVAAAVVAGLAAWGLALARALRRGREAGDLAGVLLPLGLLALALLVRFAGLDWEVGSGYYRDEGIYRATALRIDSGRLLVHSFIYGHFLHYAAAFALWLHSLFPGAAARLARRLYGVQGDARVEWLAMRAVSALSGALTVLPVYGIARRIAGRAAGGAGVAAGAIAGLLIVACPLYNEVAHLLISDVPAAFFATLCLYFAARLLDGESARDYLLAGAAAGLAAGSKYPAGLAAVAIAALWAWWRRRERRWSWSLAGAALAAVAAMLAVMPALAVYPGAAFSGEGRDALFGLRQYGEGGWIGVMPESNLGWYAGRLVESFGVPALALGFVGIFFLPRRERLRLALMLPFPVAYLALLAALHMVVKRNLQPVLPALAAVLGAGVVGWACLAADLAFLPPGRGRVGEGGRTGGGRVRTAFWGASLLALAWPAWAITAQTLSMSRAGTREVAVDWIRAHLPRGATVVKETYTPNLAPSEYATVQRRFAARLSIDQILDPEHDYLLLAETAYGRFFQEENLTKPHHRLMAATYRRLLALPRMQDFRGGATRRGPHLSLYRLDPPRIEYATARRFAAAEAAFLSEPSLAPRRAGGPLVFGGEGQWTLFKGYFAPGGYEARIEGVLPAGAGGNRGAGGDSGRLEVRTREGRDLGSAPWRGGAARFSVPEPAKLFLYIRLPRSARLRALNVARLPSQGGGTRRPAAGEAPASLVPDSAARPGGRAGPAAAEPREGTPP